MFKLLCFEQLIWHHVVKNYVKFFSRMFASCDFVAIDVKHYILQYGYSIVHAFYVRKIVYSSMSEIYVHLETCKDKHEKFDVSSHAFELIEQPLEDKMKLLFMQQLMKYNFLPVLSFVIHRLIMHVPQVTRHIMNYQSVY